MSEKPILFSGEMVRAILDGRKTQTRRIVKFPKWMHSDEIVYAVEAMNLSPKKRIVKRGVCDGISDKWNCPYGSVGDRLWIRETHYLWGYWTVDTSMEPKLKTSFSCRDKTKVMYCDNPPDVVAPNRAYAPKAWHMRPSIFMPRWASRITLEITNIRVERLNDISEEDAKAEGTIPSVVGADLEHLKYRAGFQTLWDSINANRSPWESNPWVWVIEFKMI